MARSWAELATDMLNVIDQDETGGVVANDATAWTGTDAAGLAVGDNCDGWLCSSAQGSVGDARSVLDWAAATAQSCSEPAHLYCFEQ